MSEQINTTNIPTIGNQRQIYFKQNPSVPAPNATTMQGVTDKIPQSVGDTQLGNRVKNSEEMAQSPYTLPVTVGVWYAIAQAMERFNKKCNGTYDESILGKITGSVDNLCEKITKSPAYNSGKTNWIKGLFSSTAAYIDKITSNPQNRLLYSLRNHKTNPECKLVKTTAAGLDGFFTADTRQVFEKFLEPATQAIQLNQYGISKDVIDEVSRLHGAEKLARIEKEEFKFFGETVEKVEEEINRLSKAEKIARINKKMTELGKPFNAGDIAKWNKKTDAELNTFLKDLKLKELKITKGLGFDSLSHYTKLTEENYMLTHLKELREALLKGNQKLKVMIWKKDGVLSKISNHLFGRNIGIAELANKTALTGQLGAKTKLGKLTGKSFGYLTEGCTNRFGGGKLAVFMQAFIFADMLIHTFKAPKGEKGKTFAERFVNDFTYFLAMPLGIWLMHKTGGLKYLGMTAKQRDDWRALQKIFNDNHKMYGKKMYTMRKKVLKRQLSAGVKNPFYKLLKKGASMLTVGIERFKPYISKSAVNNNWWRWTKYGLRNAVGYPIRFLIPMALLSPLFAKWTTKATHKIFGRPTESVLDENKEEEKEEQLTPSQQTTPAKNPNEYISDTNLIKNTINKMNEQKLNPQTADNAGQGAERPQRTYIPSPGSTIKPAEGKKPTDNKELEPVRTYIPNPQGMVPNQTPDMSEYNAAMIAGDKAEEYINSVLKSV